MPLCDGSGSEWPDEDHQESHPGPNVLCPGRTCRRPILCFLLLGCSSKGSLRLNSSPDARFSKPVEPAPAAVLLSGSWRFYRRRLQANLDRWQRLQTVVRDACPLPLGSCGMRRTQAQPRPTPRLSKECAAYSTFAIPGNPMFAMSRHSVAMFLHELLVGLDLLASRFLLEMPDSHLTI